MTIKEFIDKLSELPPDMVVLSRRTGSFNNPYWGSMDTWRPDICTVRVVPSDYGLYRKPLRDEPAITALEL